MTDMNNLNLNDLMKMYHAEVDKTGDKANKMLSRVYSALAFDNRIQGLVRKKLTDEHLREEALSELWIRVWMLGDLKDKRWNPEKSSFTTWAYVHLQRICVDIHRKRKTSKAQFTDDLESIHALESKDTLEKYLDQDELNAWRHQFEQALPHLPEDQKTLMNHCREGKLGTEIAKLMGINPSDVTKKKNKASITIQFSRISNQDCEKVVF